MIHIDSLITISGMFMFLATFLFLLGRRSAPYVMFLIMGTGGLAIFWDRWSARAGDRAHLHALLTPVTPASSELVLLLTHLPMFVFGLAGIISLMQRHGGHRQSTLDK